MIGRPEEKRLPEGKRPPKRQIAVRKPGLEKREERPSKGGKTAALERAGGCRGKDVHPFGEGKEEANASRERRPSGESRLASY
ncbi:hypothetical protein DMP06_09410 [Slackia equolifaciens]|uniref:Uncharacterized protein n=1 Tax=Slackia equolifaciens TaxID=498718 RepID=A0A3N0ATL5_9ACTN|nr:hypothetical protein DMP06_09410 [Slackia equolifaciens]